MSTARTRSGRIETTLWPYLDRVVESWAVPGLAVAVVHDGNQILTSTYGSRDVANGQPVTADSLFHLASVSKVFVATAALQLAEDRTIDLDAPIPTYLPDLAWADPRAGEITVRHLLSHRSGLGDVSGDYGWHEPELDDEALGRFAERVAGWRLENDPGATFAYSNAGFELLGHLIATVGGRTFESHLKERVLDPAGMRSSTFMRAEVPTEHAALPHLGLPLQVVPGAYPYTRRHSTSSTLHSSAAELAHWIVINLAGGTGVLNPATHRQMWEPVVTTDWGGMNEQMALGWFWGPYAGHQVVNHHGEDPGFLSSLAIVPELGAGVVVLANSNTAPTFTITKAALSVLAGEDPGDLAIGHRGGRPVVAGVEHAHTEAEALRRHAEHAPELATAQQAEPRAGRQGTMRVLHATSPAGTRGAWRTRRPRPAAPRFISVAPPSTWPTRSAATCSGRDARRARHR